MDVNGSECELSAGQVFLLRPGEVHAYTRQEELSVRNVIWMKPGFTFDWRNLAMSAGYRALFELEPQLRGRSGLTRCLVLTWEQRQEIDGLINQLMAELKNPSPGQQLMLYSLFGVLMVRLCRLYERMAAEDHGEMPHLASALAYLHSHLYEPMDFDKLQELSCMSRASFYRHFSEAVGRSPAQYVLHARLESARRQLRENRKSITDIALDCGFGGSSHFSTVFQQAYHQSPRQYRQLPAGAPQEK